MNTTPPAADPTEPLSGEDSPDTSRTHRMGFALAVLALVIAVFCALLRTLRA